LTLAFQGENYPIVTDPFDPQAVAAAQQQKVKQ